MIQPISNKILKKDMDNAIVVMIKLAKKLKIF